MLRYLLQWRPPADGAAPAGLTWARWVGRGWAHISYALTVEPTWLEVNRLEIPVAGLPPGFAGLRVVHLSDLHCSRTVTAEYLAEAAALAQAQHPDVVLVTGDFVHAGHGHVGAAGDAVARLSAPLGVWAVLGNHDYSIRNSMGIRRIHGLHESVIAALTARGVRVLRNEAVLWERGGDRLCLVGLDDLWSRAFDPDRAFAGLPAEVPRVVMAHNPQSIDRLGGHRCDLMLSGHTHGGQVNLPGLGPVALSKLGRRYAAGLYRHRGGYLYVSKGVGHGVRVRYNARPEVAVLTLRPLAAGP